MEFLQHIGLFLAQVVILVGAFIALILTIATVVMKAKSHKTFEVEILNEKFEDHAMALKSMLLPSGDLKKEKKRLKQIEKEKGNKVLPTIYVLDFLKGDITASAADRLAEEISTILTVAQKNEEIIINVESPGGIVHGYGYAAAQILRLREFGLNVTVCVDKVAASGGYLMACVAHKIIASPFAIIGSIGVVASVPNFNKLLKKHNVDYHEYTAGDYKRTVSVFGEITPKGEQKFLEQLEATHRLFKSFVVQFRPQLNLDQVATGEYWYGQDAVKLGLVDEIQTGDDYILKKTLTHKVIKLSFEKKPTLSEKISNMFSMVISSTFRKTLHSVAQTNNSLEQGSGAV